MTIQITDEMRRAVLLEMCETQGHAYSLQNILRTNVDDVHTHLYIGVDENNVLPYVSCLRCEKTWILIDEPGDGYDDAEMKIRKRLLKSDKWNQRPDRSRQSGPKPS